MNIHVLIVEDDPGCVELLSNALRERTEANYEVESAATLAAAVKRLRAGGIDAVLLDLSLPDSCGVDNILKIATAAPDVGVIVLTGWANTSLVAPAKAAGADAVLFKPADTPEISKKLQYVVIQRRCVKEFAPIEATLAKFGDLVMRLDEAGAKQLTAVFAPLKECARAAKPTSGRLIHSC